MPITIPDEVVEALRRLECERQQEWGSGLKAKVILYTDGDGAFVLEDISQRKFATAIDFDAGDDLMKKVSLLAEMPNVLDD